MTQTNPKKHAANPSIAMASPVAGPIPTPLIGLIRQHRYAEAYDELRTLDRSPLIIHTAAVCAMRCGKLDDTVAILRGLTLIPGTTVMRPDADDTVKINFALAMLLKGSPSGALDILRELKDRESLPAIRIRAAITRWTKNLSCWRRLDWKLNRIDPPSSHVPIDFEIGILPIVLEPDETTSTTKTNPISSRPIVPEWVA